MKSVVYGLRHKEHKTPLVVGIEVTTWTDRGETEYEINYRLEKPSDQSEVPWTTPHIYVVLLLKEFLPTGDSDRNTIPTVHYLSNSINEYEVVAYHKFNNTLVVPSTSGVPQDIYDVYTKVEVFENFFHAGVVWLADALHTYTDVILRTGEYPSEFNINYYNITTMSDILYSTHPVDVEFDPEVIKHEFFKLMALQYA